MNIMYFGKPNNRYYFFLILMQYVYFATTECVNKPEDIFDFVVVGAGVAGCVIAARLTENPRFSVLLLEAGGEPPFVSMIPSLANLMKQTEVDWNYTSVPQKNALLSYPNQSMNLTRGRMLGGTGSLNNLNFFRGNRLDFKNWERNGAKGWGWNKVLPSFIIIENDHEDFTHPLFHGHFGPICITNPGRNEPFINSFLTELYKMGYVYNDPNGDGTQTGYSFASINVCFNRRMSTYTNYLRPVLSRKNLKVETYAFVEKIVFDKSKRAIGVVYSKNGCRRTVRVRREVIVSGGAINSPQLLMLSGIGPRSHLESLNIPVLSDLPVGENFQDHIKMDLFFTKPYEDIYNNKTLALFYLGIGPLTKFSYGNAFINTRFSKNFYHPDIQFSLRSFSGPVAVGENLPFILRAIHSRPKSVGFVRLKSADPKEHPIIDPQYLSNKEDVEILAEASKIGVKLMKSMSVSQYGYTRKDIVAPACDHLDNSSDEYWHCVVRNNANTVWHFSGTCKMGAKYNKSSVVDNKLRVIGVKGLRVADASVMPSITTGNIQAVVMMIAERAAKFILDYHSTVW